MVNQLLPSGAAVPGLSSGMPALLWNPREVATAFCRLSNYHFSNLQPISSSGNHAKGAGY